MFNISAQPSKFKASKAIVIWYEYKPACLLSVTDAVLELFTSERSDVRQALGWRQSPVGQLRGDCEENFLQTGRHLPGTGEETVCRGSVILMMT